MMRFVELFAGIGGFSLGFERAGMECVGHVEIDKYARRVLKMHWPDVKLLKDVKEVKGDEYGNVDLVCGGFPCQDISVAGKQRGIHGERSSLFNEIIRICGVCRPRFIVLENVANLLSRPDWFGYVLGRIAEIGYDAEWEVIRASDVGAPHRRARIWIVAYPSGPGTGNNGREASNQRWPASNQGTKELRQGNGKVGSVRIEPGGENVADTPSQRSWKSGRTRPRGAGLENRGWWKVEPNVGRVANGIPTTLDIGRIKTYIEDYGYKRKSEMEKKASENDTAYKMRILRYYIESAKASWRLEQSGKGSGFMPEMSCKYRLHDGEMGQGAENRTDMCDMWQEIPTKMQPQTQNLQCGLPLCPWQAERFYSVGQRVDRLKCLGNALVPQIAEWIGKQIIVKVGKE